MATHTRRPEYNRPLKTMSQRQYRQLRAELEHIEKSTDSTEWRHWDDQIRALPGFSFPQNPIPNDPDFCHPQLFQRADAAIIVHLFGLTADDDDDDDHDDKLRPTAWLFELFTCYGDLLDPNWNTNSSLIAPINQVQPLPFRWTRRLTPVLLEILQDLHRRDLGIDENDNWSPEHADGWKYWSVADLTKAIRMFRLARLAEASQPGYRFSYTRQALGADWTFHDINQLRNLHRCIDAINKLLGDW